MKSFWGNLYSHLAIFYWSHCSRPSHHKKIFIPSYAFFRRRTGAYSIKLFYLHRCYQIWRNFISLWQFLNVYLTFGKIVNLLWQLLCYWAKIQYCVKYFKNNIAIWSHWSSLSFKWAIPGLFLSFRYSL